MNQRGKKVRLPQFQVIKPMIVVQQPDEECNRISWKDLPCFPGLESLLKEAALQIFCIF